MFGVIGKAPQNVPDKRKTFLDKCIKDREGRIAIGSWPNVPLAVWLVATLVGMFLPRGSAGNVFHGIAYGALFTWAWLELFEGVNYFRRLLGVVVILLLLVSVSHTGQLM